jgi:DNA-binding HxlR family transcriptional regulator
MNNRDSLPVKLQTRSSDLTNILDRYRDDEYCATLLTIFAYNHPKRMGFNEISRQVAKRTGKRKASPNALLKHLKHLIDHGVIQVKEDASSNLKITPTFYSLTENFVELGEDLFVVNDGLDVELLKEELAQMSASEASRQVAFIILNDALDSVRDSLVLDPKIADFKLLLKSARIKVALEAYSSLIRDSCKKEEALKVLGDINGKLSSYTEFSEASER